MYALLISSGYFKLDSSGISDLEWFAYWPVYVDKVLNISYKLLVYREYFYCIANT